MEDDAILNDRKDRLLAKLEQRNGERKAEVLSNTDVDKVDQLMKSIRCDLEEQKVDSLKVERLQEYQAFSVSNRQSKAIQILLEDVRKFKLTKKPAPKFTGFSFSKPSSTQPKRTVTEAVPTQLAVSAASASENVITDVTGENRIISGKKGDEISLKNIENCRLQFNFEPSVVHMRDVKDSTLVFLRCDRSVLMHDCKNLNIFVAAQQIRIHTSKDIRLHVATRGAVILEDSTEVFLCPYRLKDENGEYLAAEDNGEWRSPRDFNWLSTAPSPNWTLVPEDNWTEEQLVS